MQYMAKGKVKNESFSRSLERSEETVNLMVDIINGRARRYCTPIVRDKARQDQGDILTWIDCDKWGKRLFETIDVKQALEWVGKHPPESWGGLYVTTLDELHKDWKYVIFNQDCSYCAIADMSKIHRSAFIMDDTTNRRGGGQVSVKLPISCFTFFEVQT